jgi:hypothetical protein
MYTISYSRSYKPVLLLGIALLFLVGFNLINAESWSNPPASPPLQNSLAPINVGATSQNKLGDLGVVQLRAGRYCSADGTNCSFTLGGNGIDGAISGESPTLSFRDTAVGTNSWDSAGARDFQLHVNGNYFYLLVDRDDDGNLYEDVDAAGAWPVQISAGNTSAEDYALFSNQVRANTYCDRSGDNCIVPDPEKIIVGGKCFQPANLVVCNWNWSGDGNDDSTFVDYGSDPVAACGGRTYVRHHAMLAGCAADTYYWLPGSWTQQSSVACRIEGSKVTDVRQVLCMNGVGASVPETNCIAGAKPATTRTYDLNCRNNERPG